MTVALSHSIRRHFRYFALASSRIREKEDANILTTRITIRIYKQRVMFTHPTSQKVKNSRY